MGKRIPRTRCSGKWTEAQFITFVKNQLRKASWKWSPISEALKEAKVGHGKYRCNGCKLIHQRRDVSVDHILPIIDPSIGFTSWDEFINRLYCEVENLQVLCKDCHDNKTNREKEKAKERRKK